MTNLALYLHIPFCMQKCRYCDFLSFSAELSAKQDYLDALRREITAQGRMFQGNGQYRLYSVFIGGGTPSIIEGGQMEELLSTVWDAFGQEPATKEVTLEANPGTITRDKISAWKRAGVTRISVGVQATQDALLRRLGRIHTWDEAAEGILALQQADFRSVSVDLMMGLPGQSQEDWDDTLSRIILLSVQHISCYSLIVEEGTPFALESIEGSLRLPSDGEERAMYHNAVQRLESAGYGQYEISNFARPGFECLHNLCYWDLTPYVGLGLGASSYLEGTRYHNTEDFQTYISSSRVPEAIQEDRLAGTPASQMEEFMFLGLRKTRGIEARDFQARFGSKIEDVYGGVLNTLQRKGLIECGEGRVRLTRRGLDFANQVFVEFLLDSEPLRSS